MSISSPLRDTAKESIGFHAFQMYAHCGDVGEMSGVLSVVLRVPLMHW